MVASASVVAAAGVLAACGSGDAPSKALAEISDVPQPPSPRQGPQEDPSGWQETTIGAMRLLLPADATGPTAHEDWGQYASSYDIPGQSEENGAAHRILTGQLSAGTSANGARQVVDRINSFLIENYVEIDRISWDQDEATGIERIAFYWGPTGSDSGWTWLSAGDSGEIAIVTLFGAPVDDGLRNGIEESMTYSEGE
ncbi:hypothetical protein NSA19_08080 [Actinomyces bowdenii]|uniref:hypothetical protein n=1 Tax=Actinomyces bowdenii TaxID=131109 RepID=UPI00214AA700|nr:hypothetical protein [Actinomyces bowdenii]MCR2052800.1 hypothetical protein [Actinomyces bowdenii]